MAYPSDKAFGGDLGGPPLSDGERMRRLSRLQTVAMIMDTAIAIPGTNIRFGADSLLGLVPGIGDFAGALVGLAIVNEARRLGVPGHKMAKMIANIGVDTLVGAVPLLGDVFDVYFKSHRRNVQLILDHFEGDGSEPRQTRAR
jgi:hypothetical protein